MVKYSMSKNRRKDGRYQGCAYIYIDDKSYVYDKNRQECKRKLTDLVEQLEQGLSDGNMLFSSLLAQWQNIHCPTLADTTRSEYNRYCNNYLPKKFLSRKISELMPSDIQKLITSFSATHSEKSSKNLKGILSSIFSYALKNRIIKFNPCIGISIQKTEKYEYRIYTVEELILLLDKIGNQRESIPVVLAALCGLRKSEILALKWNDIDFKKNTLKVNKACVHVGSEVIVKPYPKTGSSNRIIHLPEYALDVLRTNKSVGIIYPNKDGKHENGRNYGKRFRSLLIKKDMPITRFHDLRHFAATSLMDAGLPDKAISEYLGHSDTNMTKKYQHILDAKKTAPAIAMNQIVPLKRVSNRVSNE